jgi:PIN domain nuclease of toxin-antitoxin system
VSIATFWELAIKISLGKLTLPDAIDRYFPQQMMENGFEQMAIDLGQIARCATLPFHHRDPFDRMLAAQALEGDFPIISRDPVFTRYGVKRIW